MNRSKWNIERNRRAVDPQHEAPWTSELAELEVSSSQSQGALEDEIRHLARGGQGRGLSSHDTSKRKGVPAQYAKKSRAMLTLQAQGRRRRDDRKSARRGVDEEEGSGLGY